MVFLLLKPVIAEAQIRLRVFSYFALEWQPTPLIWPGKFYRQGSLVGCSPWCHKESDTTERLNRKTQPRLEVHGAENSEEAPRWHVALTGACKVCLAQTGTAWRREGLTGTKLNHTVNFRNYVSIHAMELLFYLVFFNFWGNIPFDFQG